ncbi:hypothetical protein VNO78_29015 [Psophocarpus tetragonolobus]|uniref:Uncharacterized protein n=1 Tax=Psophocarpus tetragonolobus TaxID=3891 RepID=A0AAN9WZS3_PSOTE
MVVGLCRVVSCRVSRLRDLNFKTCKGQEHVFPLSRSSSIQRRRFSSKLFDFFCGPVHMGKERESEKKAKELLKVRASITSLFHSNSIFKRAFL